MSLQIHIKSSSVLINILIFSLVDQSIKCPLPSLLNQGLVYIVWASGDDSQQSLSSFCEQQAVDNHFLYFRSEKQIGYWIYPKILLT